MTRSLAAGPDRFEGGVKVQQLVSERASFGRVGRWRGANSDGFEMFWTIWGEFLLEDFTVGIFAQSLPDGGGGIVYSSPAVGCIFRATEEGVREGKAAPVYPGDFEGVLFTHEIVGALLALARKVAIGEMVAVEALMSATE